MILVPTFGVFLVKALRDDTSLFPREDKSEYPPETMMGSRADLCSAHIRGDSDIGYTRCCQSARRHAAVQP